MSFMRARSDAQKNMRLGQIVSAALKLYEELPYEKITLAAIAKELDFTRANLYKYVETKEEIFLLAISKDLEAFVEDVEAELGRAGPLEAEAFAMLWAGALYRHERLLRLFSILFTIIEKNVTARSLAVFKKQLFADISRLAPVFSPTLPQLKQEDIFLFLNMQIHYAAGLYPSLVLNEVQQEALRLSGISYEPEAFVPAFAKFTTVTIKGLQASCADK